MPRSRSRSRSRTSSESESESQDSDSAGSEAGVKESAGELLLQDKHGPPVDVTQLEKFFSSKKRIDAPEEKLVLQSPTVAMYFRDLLGQGKLDKDSAKELRKKYYMGDKSYKALAPPTLSDTKLHMIQTHEAGGVYNKFLGIHINHRDSLKLFLRSYELLGGCADVFEGFEPMHPYVEDAVVDKFELPTLTSVVKEVSDTEIEQLLPVSSDGIVDIEELRKLARSKIALSKLVEKQGSAYLDVLELLQKATNVAVVGVSMHGNLTDIMWDALQLFAQTDLSIKEAREARVEEYLTASFKTALKAANRDKSSRTEKHVQDKLLHRDLDKLVKEEAKTNSKMSRIVKPSAGETSGGSRGKPSGSSRYSSPPRTNYRKRGGGSGDVSGKWKKSKKKKFGQQKDGAKKEDRKDSGKKEDKGSHR